LINVKFEHPLFFVNLEGERVDAPRIVTTTKDNDSESEDIGSTSEEEGLEDDDFDANKMFGFA
jgi:hypothetical protein